MRMNKTLLIGIGVLVVILILATGGLAYSRTHPLMFSQPRAVVITEQELAEKYGMQLILTAMTGMDSYVDVRFRILDASKAEYILEDPQMEPLLRLETGSHQVLSSPSNKGAHHHNLRTGSIYLMLFPNPNRIVKSGTPVRLIFGNRVMEPVIIP